MSYPARLVAIFAVLITSWNPTPALAQLSLQWMVPAAASTPGLGGTFWRTDLSLHNPHPFDLPVVLQFLPSDSDNSVADTLYLTLYPWETYNFWDVLGPDGFSVDGTGALLVFADWDLECDPEESCDFLVTSRTYTRAPGGGDGEYGQTIPGSNTWQGVDWTTLGYAAGVLNDGLSFRANIGITSWSAGWTVVVADVQNADGDILESFTYQVPPFGHFQERLATEVEGGTVVFWLDDGPDDALVFGYVSVVNQITGDASFQLAQPSTVGFASAKARVGSVVRRPVPGVGSEIADFPAAATRAGGRRPRSSERTE